MIVRLPIALACIVFQVPPLAAPVNATKVKGLRHEHASIIAAEAARLTKLADRWEATGKATEGRAARALIAAEPNKDGPRRFVPLPEIVLSAKDDKNLASKPVEPPEIIQIRTETAKTLLDFAQRAGKAHRLAIADVALREVLDRKPNDAEARRLLGYVPRDGGWTTRYAARKLKDNWTLHPKYGWVESAWVPFLEDGQLPAVGGSGKGIHWIPAADADAQRRDFSRPWTISTEHFQIRTNVSLAEGIIFARKLEDFYQLFFAYFADLIGPDHPLTFRLTGKEPRIAKPRPHLIDYFSSHAEFVSYLRSIDVDPKDSLGFYIPPTGSTKRNPSYFYKDDGGEISSVETLYHEASHQLLFENAGPALLEKNVGNYWPFEGLGCYFETVRPLSDGSMLVGGRVGRRFEVARGRILIRKEYTKLDRFVAMGKKAFFEPPEGDVYLDYGQAMALTIYMLESDRGQYRDEFLDYVRDVYKGRYKANSGKPLDERLGTTFDELDRRFLKFLSEAGKPVER